MSEKIPTVEPIDIPDYKYKNSKYEMMPKLPARMLCVASSTGGKDCSHSKSDIKNLPKLL